MLSDGEKLDLLRKWLTPGVLWDEGDSRRKILLSIIDGGEAVGPWHLVDDEVEDWHGKCKGFGGM